MAWAPLSPTGQPLAPPGLRVGARFLDGVILAVIGLLLARLILGDANSAGFEGFGADASTGHIVLLAVVSAATGFLWDAVMTRLYGGSPMKLLFGMRVVRADNGGPVEWQHAIVRCAVPGVLVLVPIPVLPGLVTLVIVIVSLVFIFSKPLRQAIWDQVAKTLVVRPGHG